MESKSAKDLMFRLLQLEQRFESYTALYEEELSEIKHNLRQLREDILGLSRDLDAELDMKDLVTSSDGNKGQSDMVNNSSNDLSV